MMKTNKTTATKTFTELFKVILTGDKDDSRKAAREVRKLLYSSHNGGKYDDIKKIIENAPDEHCKIKESGEKKILLWLCRFCIFYITKKVSRIFYFRGCFICSSTKKVISDTRQSG